MPGPIVEASQTLTQGIRVEFADAYRQRYDVLKEKLGGVMEMDINSDKLTELYAYFESAVYPRLWRRGEEIPADAFQSVQFSVTNRDWAIRVPFHDNDVQDDQTRSLLDRAREAGANFATLDERVFFQILLAASDNSLLPAIPNAPDGLALFSSSTRFGVSGGNIESGNGVATSSAIRIDLFDGIERIQSFQDTEGQPLWPQSVMDQGYVIVYGVHNEQKFREAFLQGRTVESSATPTNIVLESGMKVDLWPSQRISSSENDWFIFGKGSPHKAVFKQLRQPLREAVGTMETSDQARSTKINYVQWDSRAGYGVFLPYQAVQINN